MKLFMIKLTLKVQLYNSLEQSSGEKVGNCWCISVAIKGNFVTPGAIHFAREAEYARLTGYNFGTQRLI